MRKGIYILLLLILAAPLHADIHRIGSYNIRVISDKDTGDKAWENRKEFVARIISDKEYDVVALQEMKDAQYRDLKALLTDYEMEYWGRDSYILSNVGEGVGVAYRTSRYTLLDKGHFFLAEDPAIPTISWDAAYRRVSIWLKLQDKNTNEVFYYCSTHLDNAGVIARREGARINVEMMLEIAGNDPCFICGDFNSSTGEPAVHNTLGAFFGDSRLLSATAPVGQEGTYSNWALSYGSQRIDYIYCRKANVWSYAVMNEDFGRGITPSDHFPVQITMSLKDIDRLPHVYVSIQGDDNNDGSIGSPLRTLQKAVSIAQQCDTVHVTEGTFYVGNSRDEYLALPRTLSFIGGYNDNFTRITGKTILSGDYNQNNSPEDNSRHCMVMNAPGLLHLENFTICDFYSDEGSSVNGGAIQTLGLGIKAVNTDFTGNYINGCGAGVYSTGKVLLDNCRFVSNRATTGGGIRIDSSLWPYDIRHSLFGDNVASSGAAIHVGGTLNGYLYGNSFVDNTAFQQGTFCFDDAGTATAITFVNNTFANNSCCVTNGIMNSIMGGSGVYVYAASDAVISFINNTFTGNLDECLKADGNPGANFYGAAMYVRKGELNLYNNIIAGNYSTAATGGDIRLSADAVLLASQYNVYTSSESNNIKSGTTDMLASTQSDGLTALSSMLEGDVREDRFITQLERTPYTAYVRIKNPAFAGKAIHVLSTEQLSEELLGIDLDNDGSLHSSLLYDQIGTLRSMSGSAIGAIEYDAGVGIAPTEENTCLLRYADGLLVVDMDDMPARAQCYVYDTMGRMVLTKNFNGNKVHIGTALPSGCYIILVRAGNYQGLLRFVQN